MKLTECSKDGFWPQPQRRRTAGMPSRAGVRHHLQVVDRRARRLQGSKHFRLRVESVERPWLAGLPVPVAPIATQEDTERGMLGIAKVAAADFEQANSCRAAIMVAPGSRDQAGQQRGPHDLHFLADRVSQ